MRGIVIDISSDPVETTFIDKGIPLTVGEILKALHEAQTPLISMLAKAEDENRQREATDGEPE